MLNDKVKNRVAKAFKLRLYKQKASSQGFKTKGKFSETLRSKDKPAKPYERKASLARHLIRLYKRKASLAKPLPRKTL